MLRFTERFGDIVYDEFFTEEAADKFCEAIEASKRHLNKTSFSVGQISNSDAFEIMDFYEKQQIGVIVIEGESRMTYRISEGKGGCLF